MFPSSQILQGAFQRRDTS